MAERPMPAAPPAGADPGSAPAQKTMAKAGALGVFVKTLTAASAYIGAVLAARLLGAESFGLYTLAMSTVQMLQFVTSGGIEHTMVRLIPIRRAISREEAIRTLGLAAQNVVIGATGVALFVSVFSTEITALLGQPNAAPWFRVMIWALPCIGLISGLGAANRAVYAFRAALAPAFVIRPVLGTLGLAVLFVIGVRAEMVVASIFLGAAAVAAAAAIVLTSAGEAFGGAWMRFRARVDREAVRLSATFLTINLASNLKGSGLVLIIGWWLTERDLGLFGAASRTAAVTVLVLSAVNITFAPIISNLWARGDREQLIATYRDTTRWTLAASAPTCLFLIVCAPGVMRMFGPEYVEAASALAWLSLGQLVNAGVGSVGMMLLMTGRQRLMLWDTAGMTFASLVAAFFVAPVYGFVGVAFIGGLFNALVNLLMLHQVRQQLGVMPYDRRTLNVAVAIAFAAAAGWLTMRIPAVAAAPWYISVAIQGTALMGVYGVLLGTGLTPRERQALARVLRRVRSR